MRSKKSVAIVGGISLLSLLVFAAVFASVVGDEAQLSTRHLRIAMDLLDEGRWDVAGRIARDLEEAGRVDAEEDSAWQFVQGVSKLRSVETNLDSPRNRRILLDATAHLTKAAALGLPRGCQGKGRFYLGWCNFHTYQWDKVSELLEDSERLWPERRSDAYNMLVIANLRKAIPDFEAAQKKLDVWSAIPGLSQDELLRIELAKAFMAFMHKSFDACEELLAKIPPNFSAYSDALQLRTRWRLERAAHDKRLPVSEREVLLKEASQFARELKQAPETPHDLRRQATYLSGKILRAQERFRQALGTFSSARQSNPQSAEAIAAGIEESEIMVQLGSLTDAIANLNFLLRNIEDLSLYNEHWMPKKELRSRLLDLGRSMKDQGEFEHAIQLADSLALAFPKSDSVRLQAEAYEQWAEHIEKKAELGGQQAIQNLRQQVRQKYAKAAELFADLALLELRSTEYPDIVWQALVNYQNAGKLDRANELLKDYLRHEDRTKRPRGFVALGRNYMNAAQWQKATEPLERCRIEHPTHPISFEARLMCAKSLYELNRLDEAIELLNENLYGNEVSLRPESQIWRDSLYQLGHTIFRRGDQLLLELRLQPEKDYAKVESQLEGSFKQFQSAVDQLAGFVSRYPDDPRHHDAMYMVAKSHRLAADMRGQASDANPMLVETARRKIMQQRRSLLEKALEGYRTLQSSIQQQQDLVNTTDKHLSLIRNCYFGEADTLYELGRWEEAVVAYQNVASRFLNQPESLEALLQMAECYRKLGGDEKAKKVLAQAEQVLNRIPPEVEERFVNLTRTTREGWGKLLGSLRTSWN